jgi:hypothetical protein
MFWRYGVPLIIAGVLAMLLLGWAIAYWWDRRSTEADQEFEREVMEHEKEMGRDNDR